MKKQKKLGESLELDESIEQGELTEQGEPIESRESEESFESDGDAVIVNQRDLDYAEQVDKRMEDGSFFDDWSASDMRDFNKALLGHDESLRTGDAKVIGAIIKRLAEDMDLVRKFDSINVLHSENKDFLACVNMHDNGLYINASNDFIKPFDLVRTIRGLVLHECFVGDSIVTMADGSGKRIKNIHMELEEGKDVFVKTFDAEKRAFTIKPVLASFVKESDSIFDIQVNGEKVSATNNHPFLVLDNGIPFWKRADELKKGDMIISDKDGYREKKSHVSRFNDFAYRFSFSSSDIDIVKVENVRKKRVSKTRNVYNLSVADTNNYIVNGLVVKNCGHINRYLGVPGTKERGVEHGKNVKKGKGDPGALNWVYDLEIHFQAIEKGVFSKGDQLELMDFLSVTRASMEKAEPTSPMLCMESGPKTELQEKVKVITDDRSKGVVKKAIEVSKLWEQHQKQKGSGDGGSQGSGQGGGKGKCTCKEEGKEPGTCDHCKRSREGRKLTVVVYGDEDMRKVAGEHHAVEEITGKIEDESKIKELSDKVIKCGINKGTVEDVVKHFKRTGRPLERMGELLKSLKDMLTVDSGFLRSTVTEEKSGSRLNGVRPIRDIHEVTENVEQLATDGRFDLEGVRIDKKVKRRQKGYVFIIRDVSGSICDEHVSKVVRDSTMYLIGECKKAKHKVCVIDFNTDSYAIVDKKGKEVTDEHEELLCKSTYLKAGGGTELGVAIDRMNSIIKKNGLEDIPINIYIITDSGISDYHRFRGGKVEHISKVKIQHNKYNLNGLVYNESIGSKHDVDEAFRRFMKANHGRTFFIELDDTKKLVKGLKAVV